MEGAKAKPEGFAEACEAAGIKAHAESPMSIMAAKPIPVHKKRAFPFEAIPGDGDEGNCIIICYSHASAR
jgi:hypothetical protein